MANEKLICSCGNDEQHAKYVEKNGEVVVECATCGRFLKYTYDPKEVPAWTKEHEELSELQVFPDETVEELSADEQFKRDFEQTKKLRETQTIAAGDVGTVEEVLGEGLK